MPEMVAIDPELVKEKTSIFRRRLKDSRFDFYASISKRDAKSGSGMPSLETSIVVHSFEHFLGTAAAFKETIQRNGLLNGSYKVKDQFVDLFSYFAGAAAGSSLVERLDKQAQAPITLPGRHAIDFSKGEFLVLDDLVQTYLKGTSHIANGELLLGTTKDFYSWVIAEAVRQKDDPALQVLAKQAESAHVRVDGIVLNGFRYLSCERVETRPADYRREDYVGNKELLLTLERSLIELFDYDFVAKKNPNISLGGFSQTITVWGEGGMGKSMGIAIALNEAKARANKLGIPFIVRELRGFKSEYFGKSAQNLRELFQGIQKGDAVYAVVAEDIDTVFFAREELKNRSEDKDILGELMNQLEGLASNTLGNYVMIATSNHPLHGDGPLMDRLRQCQVHVKGPETSEDYVAVFQAKLRPGVQAGAVKVRDWGLVGRLAQESGLSNRDVRNVCLGVLASTKNYERPQDFYSMGYDARVACLSSNRVPVGERELKDALTSYVQGIEAQRLKDFDSIVAQELQKYRLSQEVARKVKEGAHAGV